MLGSLHISNMPGDPRPLHTNDSQSCAHLAPPCCAAALMLHLWTGALEVVLCHCAAWVWDVRPTPLGVAQLVALSLLVVLVALVLPRWQGLSISSYTSSTIMASLVSTFRAAPWGGAQQEAVQETEKGARDQGGKQQGSGARLVPVQAAAAAQPVEYVSALIITEANKAQYGMEGHGPQVQVEQLGFHRMHHGTPPGLQQQGHEPTQQQHLQLQPAELRSVQPAALPQHAVAPLEFALTILQRWAPAPQPCTGRQPHYWHCQSRQVNAVVFPHTWSGCDDIYFNSVHLWATENASIVSSVIGHTSNAQYHCPTQARPEGP
jgi:hypothetical protein